MEQDRVPLLELRGLCKFYTGPSVVMGLNHADLRFYAGEFVAITGESGSGKSTLAHVMAGILPYESGELYFRGKATSHFDSGEWEDYRRDNISFISQNYGIIPGATVGENVMSSLYLAGMGKKEAKQRAEQLLKMVQLWELRHRRAGKMSSGQKQRLSIARALAKPAPILIADEPTGNLDPQNSALVIQLLAQAAKERLVILITHDFYEAGDYVTRHIQLQDGRVTMDAHLGQAVPGEPAQLPSPERRKRRLSAYIAALQVRSRPVWTALLCIFFGLTAFAVFAFLGTLTVNLDDTSTRIYDSSAFPNGDPLRIVVQRMDEAPMTEEDYQYFLSIKHVSTVEQAGYVCDWSYAYREDVDYKIHYSQTTDDEGQWVTKPSIELLSNMRYVRTIPMMENEDSFLKAGRLPENLYEVVLGGDESQIGSTIDVYITNTATWNRSAYLHLTVQVVGVTDQGEGLYFSRELGRSITSYTLYTEAKRYYGNYLLLPEVGQQLEDGQCQISEDLYQWVLTVGSYMPSEGQTIDVADKNKIAQGDPISECGRVLTVIENNHDSYMGVVFVTAKEFEELVLKENSNQVSLYITNYAYADRVLEKLQEAGYLSVSPYQYGATEKDEDLVLERRNTLLICVAALVAIVALQIIVLRELFLIQLDSYKLLANQGLSSRTARRSVLWQILAFTVIGQLLGCGGIAICNANGVERILSIVRYLQAGHWAILSATHLVAALLGAAAIDHALRKTVFPTVGTPMDLQLEEERL